MLQQILGKLRLPGPGGHPEAMHVFKPVTVFGPLYVKVVVRGNCVVVSFHEEVNE